MSSGPVIEPLVPVHTVGRPRTNDMRDVLNGIFHLNRSGCQWDLLPHDLPAGSTVFRHFARWRDGRRSREEAASPEFDGEQPTPAPNADLDKELTVIRGPRADPVESYR